MPQNDNLTWESIRYEAFSRERRVSQNQYLAWASIRYEAFNSIIYGTVV